MASASLLGNCWSNRRDLVNICWEQLLRHERRWSTTGSLYSSIYSTLHRGPENCLPNHTLFIQHIAFDRNLEKCRRVTVRHILVCPVCRMEPLSCRLPLHTPVIVFDFVIMYDLPVPKRFPFRWQSAPAILHSLHRFASRLQIPPNQKSSQRCSAAHWCPSRVFSAPVEPREGFFWSGLSQIGPIAARGWDNPRLACEGVSGPTCSVFLWQIREQCKRLCHYACPSPAPR